MTKLVPLARAAAALLLTVLVPVAVVPACGHAATLEVGAGKKYPLPSAAAAVAQDGDKIVIAPGEYFDCAIVRASSIVIEGASAETTVMTDKTCGGKALLVIDGDDVTVRNLTLTRARVADFNGAGIRAEGGDLTVDHVRFINNQEGILAASMPGKSIRVFNSEFVRNGTCEGAGGCAHGIYVNDYALLHIENSKFFETRQGHHIKSRAQRTEIIGCDIADGDKGTSSYAVDIPNGGAIVMRGNHIQKGPKSENHTSALMVGAEGVTQRTPEITVENNTFLVEGDYNSYLVENRTATEAHLKGNKLSGNARALHGDGDTD